MGLELIFIFFFFPFQNDSKDFIVIYFPGPTTLLLEFY